MKKMEKMEAKKAKKKESIKNKQSDTVYEMLTERNVT